VADRAAAPPTEPIAAAAGPGAVTIVTRVPAVVTGAHGAGALSSPADGASKSVFDASNLVFDASDLVFDASNPVSDASNPVSDASNPVFDASNLVSDASNLVSDASNLNFPVGYSDVETSQSAFLTAPVRIGATPDA